MTTSSKIAIAIDGPAAAGKSTVAKKVAQQINYIYIDTGAMYRALTYKAVVSGVDINSETELHHLLKTTSINLQQSTDGQEVFVDEKPVTKEIRTEEVTNNVSTVAKHRLVREEMVRRQQQLAQMRGVVMDGRDIGTHVIPDAEVKVFLIAAVDERAKRRHSENIEKGFPSDLEQIKEEIEKRDKLDSERDVAPLIKATDAVEIDTTSMSIDDVKNKIIQLVEQRLKRR